MAVADPERELGAVDALVEGHHAEEVLAVLCDGVLLGRDGDMPEPKLFFEGLHNVDVRDHLMGCRGMRGRHEGQVRSGQFAGRVGAGNERRFRHEVLSPFQGATGNR